MVIPTDTTDTVDNMGATLIRPDTNFAGDFLLSAMEQFTHIMVDIETFGTAPGSEIRSVAMCVFDPLAVVANGATADLMTQEPVPPPMPIRPPRKLFGATLHVGVAEGNGTRSAETIEWWANQSEEAQAHFADLPTYEPNGLFSRIGEFTDQIEGPRKFWANSPGFDMVLLDSLRTRTVSGLTTLDRDDVEAVRRGDGVAGRVAMYPAMHIDGHDTVITRHPDPIWTHRELMDVRTLSWLVPDGVYSVPDATHNALEDCIRQARIVANCLQYLDKS